MRLNANVTTRWSGILENFSNHIWVRRILILYVVLVSLVRETETNDSNSIFSSLNPYPWVSGIRGNRLVGAGTIYRGSSGNKTNDAHHRHTVTAATAPVSYLHMFFFSSSPSRKNRNTVVMVALRFTSRIWRLLGHDVWLLEIIVELTRKFDETTWEKRATVHPYLNSVKQ